MANTRDYLNDILQHCYKNTLFDELKLYHKKVTVIETNGTGGGHVGIDGTANQFSAQDNFGDIVPGGTIYFQATETTGVEIWEYIEPDKLYYITNVMGKGSCTRFTIGTTPYPLDIIKLPIVDDSSAVDNTLLCVSTGYFILESIPEWLNVGTAVTFFDSVDFNGIESLGLNNANSYYVKEILADNRISVSETLDGPFITVNGGNGFICYLDKTFIEGTSSNGVVTLNAETKNKITNFSGRFGIETLAEFNSILEDKNYNPLITLAVGQIANEESRELDSFVIGFTNDDGTITDNINLMSSASADEKITVKDYKGSLWNFAIENNAQNVDRFKNMTLTYGDTPTFSVYTVKNTYSNPTYPSLPHYDLFFTFGTEVKQGKLKFSTNISGTYIAQVVYEYVVKLEKANSGLQTYVAGTAPNFDITIDYVVYGILNTDACHLLVDGFLVRFSNPDDSTRAVQEAGLSTGITYVVRNINNMGFGVSLPGTEDLLDLPYSNFSFNATVIRPNTLEANIQYTNPSAGLNTSSYDGIDCFQKGKPIFFKNTYFSFAPDTPYYIKNITYGSSTVNGNYTSTKIHFTLSKDPLGQVVTIPNNSIPAQFYSNTQHTWTVLTTNWFRQGDKIKFTGLDGTSEQDLNNLDISSNSSYYIKDIIDNKRFTISDTLNGPVKTIPYDRDYTTFIISVTRDTRTGQVLTGYPQTENNPYDKSPISTIYGIQYDDISIENKTFGFGNTGLPSPTRSSKFVPLKIGDVVSTGIDQPFDDSSKYDKLFTDTTITLPLNDDGSCDVDGLNVYSFEFDRTYLDNSVPIGSSLSDEVKIYDKDKKGYLLPVGFLDKKWTFPSLEFSSICIGDNFPQDVLVEYEINGETYENAQVETVTGSRTQIRFSDQGSLMITITSNLGIYNYIIDANNKP